MSNNDSAPKIGTQAHPIKPTTTVVPTGRLDAIDVLDDTPSPERIRRLLSRREAAERLSVCERTISRFVKKGLLPEFKINSRVSRFDAADVAKLINDARVQTEGGI